MLKDWRNIKNKQYWKTGVNTNISFLKGKY